MLRTAFSTVACPDWTLDRVARAAAEYGFRGVELRSFGDGDTHAFASEPASTDPAKVRALFRDNGVDLCGLGTGVRLDAPVFPPMMGHVFAKRYAGVRAGKRMVDLAAATGARYIRVFALEVPGAPVPGVPGDTKWSALRRITNRLRDICDHARNRDVRVLIENAADFAGARDLAKIIELVGSPLLGASYDIGAGVAAGDKDQDAVKLLGPRLEAVRVRDTKAGRPCLPGQGDLPIRAVCEALNAAGSSAWVVFAWDKAWLPDLAAPETALPEASRVLTSWCGLAVAGAAAA